MKLQVKHIAKSFGEKEVLTDVSFSLESGSIEVLMGTNGSGKTTLYNIITGFLKQDKGSIHIDNKEIKNYQSNEINRLGIGRTFQDMRLIGKLTVLENVMLAFSEANEISYGQQKLLNLACCMP